MVSNWNGISEPLGAIIKPLTCDNAKFDGFVVSSRLLTAIMGVLGSPWGDAPSRWSMSDRVKWMFFPRFRQDLKARLAREAEVHLARLDVDTRLFVREIYQEQLAEQDELRLKPEQFTQVVRRRLDEVLQHTATEINPNVARTPLGYALAERVRWIATAVFAADQPQHKMRSDPSSIAHYEFQIATDDGHHFGNVAYAVCALCQQGVLDNITVDAEVGCGGLGRRALDELQRRWASFQFNTTGQQSAACGFYDRYRMTSISPWLYKLDGCPHLASSFPILEGVSLG
jgi:hypothetical protein